MELSDTGGEFTRSAYREILSAFLENGYSYNFFEEAEDLLPRQTPFVLLRHDVDLSLHEALHLAVLEHELGIKSTFFVRLRTGFYNPFNPDETSIIHELLQMGHQIGLHFDRALYGNSAPTEEIGSWCTREISQLESWFGVSIRIVSFHRPSPECLQAGLSLTGGVPHTYLPLYTERIGYCSDSRGQWGHGHPLARAEFADRRPLQLLVHPIWWGSVLRGPEATLYDFALNNTARLQADLKAEILDSYRQATLQPSDRSRSK